MLQYWKRRITGGARVAITANEDVVRASELKSAQQRIKGLERALGRKRMEVEILQAARDEIKKSLIGTPAALHRRATGPALSRNDTSLNCGDLPHALDWSRYTVPQPARTSGRYAKADDPIVTAQIREIIRQRGSYGYRRVTALVNRAFDTAYNRKRIRRVMEMNEWNLPRPGRRRSGRAHTGRIVRSASNERWCSDTLQIPCWNGDLVELGFVLDCHDREAIAHVAVPRKYRASDVQELLEAAVIARLGISRPGERVQFLSDNGSIYTALDTACAPERLGPSPVTTSTAHGRAGCRRHS